ncbi:hypothetical protein [Microbacterium hydrocarbonoxydans]|uniref:hypothetical protein n=1 Tax=Microbacterium hydrocarbonoxydans TaxID=273678 RepID=UPI0013DABAAD|nr:hypothetical protein [Microbacterium hydrocarbonoxydans]
MNTSEPQNTPRPFGYWLTAVDRLMAAEFARAFEAEGASRRDWRLLNVVDGTAPARRPLHARKLEGLIARGWVTQEGTGWALTDEGRAAKERLGALVDGIRATVADAVSPEAFATTLASLEKMAVALGWDESTPLPRRRGRQGSPRGFGRGRPFPFGRGFGPGFGPAVARHLGFGPHAGHHGHGGHAGLGHGGHGGHGHGDGCEHERRHGHGHGHGHGHPHHGRHGDHGAERTAQHAYERGFDAGYARGRDA